MIILFYDYVNYTNIYRFGYNKIYIDLDIINNALQMFHDIVFQAS
jgi:hypothetical protein